MSNFQDLTGEQFGQLTVQHVISKNPTYWQCICSCGNTKPILAGSLKSGVSQSCGCFQKKQLSERSKTHGKSKTIEYRLWVHMKSRCHNLADQDYLRYGGRGIHVCSRWRNSFENFLSDMGLRPNKYLTLERINNNKNYSLANCCWATRKEQASNTSKSRWFYAISPIGRFYKSKNQSSFARIHHIDSKCINQILTQPKRKTHKGWRFYYSAQL